MTVRSAARALYQEFDDHLVAVAASWPGRTGFVIRRVIWGSRIRNGGAAAWGRHVEIRGPQGIQVGRNFGCGRGCEIYADGGGAIHIGNNVSLNSNVHLNASIGGRITIGDDSLIGPYSVLRATNHRFDRADSPIRLQGHQAGQIEIGQDVWIGAGVIVTAGVRIGDGAVIGAGAVVTRDVPEMSLAAGVPARVLRKRGSP